MSDPVSGLSASTEQCSWSDEALQSRIEDAKRLKRFEAGSPNAEEIEAYRKAASCLGDNSVALVLGMTPELRKMAVNIFERIISAEKNASSIAIFRDWLTPVELEKERIIKTDWLDLKRHIIEPVSAIFGDGVFGNLLEIADQRKLLLLLGDLLTKTGSLVVRKAIIPKEFDPEYESFESILSRYREGELDLVEFGFASRLLGHYKSCFTPSNYILDNNKLYDLVDRYFHSGKITVLEYQAIKRYYFTGKNCIISQQLWEDMLEQCGFVFKTFNCYGRDWYRYYKVYQCRIG